MNKLLLFTKIIFSLLFLIIILEVYFLLNYDFNKNHRPANKKETNQIELISKILPTVISPSGMPPSSLTHLIRYQYSPSNSLTIKIVLKVKILEIKKNVYYPYKKFNSPLALKIIKLHETINLNKAFWMYMTRANLEKTKVYIKKNNILQEGSIEDLKVGDIIEFHEEYNPMYTSDENPNRTVSINIYKIKTY